MKCQDLVMFGSFMMIILHHIHCTSKLVKNFLNPEKATVMQLRGLPNSAYLDVFQN